ncbi:MAG: hypothetical protein AAF483_21880 [Planctomycetota bacterium]
MTEQDNLALREISTRWSCVKDVNRFTLRYISAMSRLLQFMMKEEDSSKEVLQRFLLKVVERGFNEELPKSGRFRDYLARSLRNAAIDFYREKNPAQAEDFMLVELADGADPHEEMWQESWTECLLDRAWQKLEQHQYTTVNCYYHTILRLACENGDQSSAAMATIVSNQLPQSLSAESYRKQLSRARRKFAGFLATEVRETLEAPTDADLAEELATLGLKRYLDRFDANL